MLEMNAGRAANKLGLFSAGHFFFSPFSWAAHRARASISSPYISEHKFNCTIRNMIYFYIKLNRLRIGQSEKKEEEERSDRRILQRIQI